MSTSIKIIKSTEYNRNVTQLYHVHHLPVNCRGQFVDHDLDLGGGGEPTVGVDIAVGHPDELEDFNVDADAIIHFERDAPVTKKKKTTPAKPVRYRNHITSWRGPCTS